MKLDSFILHQIDRLSVNKCHAWDIMTSLVKNWRLSLFLIYLSLSIRSYLPTETWVPRTTMKQNFLFLYRWMGTRKIPKSSTAYSLIFMSYELSVVNTVFRSKRGGLWKQGLSTQVYEQDLRGPGIGQDVMLAVILGKRENCTVIRGHFHWVEITLQGGHVVQQTIQIFIGICTKKKQSLVPRREKRISYCPPTWPQWLQLQTSNTDKKVFVFKQKWLDICMWTRKTISEKLTHVERTTFLIKLTLHDVILRKIREIRLITSFAGMKAALDYWEEWWTSLQEINVVGLKPSDDCNTFNLSRRVYLLKVTYLPNRSKTRSFTTGRSADPFFKTSTK